MPDGQDVALESAELHQQLVSLYKGPIYLLQSGRGFFDTMDLSLISTATVRTIGESADVTLDPLRFRSNILIEAFDDALMPENAWVAGLLIFGERDTSAAMCVNRKDVRCMITNLDPVTSQQTPTVLRTIVNHHAQCAGVYGSPERIGTIHVGDIIRLVKE
ncbi:MAG: MOSC domain-containing protein [Chloroflexi bacterium AL-W]|nr:MOSC domain-containing protein [Chloroflexi bacterium AL-N1]NOK70635.1 MOSC domain-containing protein [Chloroflexi bacterium AL-N10]NOK77627.1 MOSC domain-containing protein [Chloroflexi bacterium AL-N5]NOK84478.1 MOSC domain-containing protein [Chloroflexi bacterium AL-W]NOK92367.1 MOSC domain-containing protein [Chloroflexi bacterium AL-N15]